MKTCKKCGLEFEGRVCKPCKCQYMREWNAKNPEKVRESKRKKYLRTKETCRLRDKRWVEKNREKSNAIKKAYKQRNRETYLASQREYAKSRYIEKREELLSKRKSPEALKVMAAWREKNRERLNQEYLEKYHHNPELNRKHKARGIVNKAIQSGKMLKPDKCTLCAYQGKLHAHHLDYDMPMNVTWLCIPCHRNLHSKYFKQDEAGALS